MNLTNMENQVQSTAKELIDQREVLYYNVVLTYGNRGAYDFKYLPFDRHWSLTACLKRENGIVENNIYLFNAEDPGEVLDMKVGVLRYLELAYQAKAIYHWQYAYLFRDSIHSEKLRVMLPIIFPHVKLDLASFGG